ncbi:head GIN domain-containing protein [Fulvivirga lutimaris]|uniref:head GIN domain-containing protein n=1 Tax=Fulvivirga lutimaris TaxID=1819566 RepID=UPI0012BBBC7E|nr:head GIN domain-containing protein [Fulvivirga lutimaris]MTI39357.1 DUF2807 domain-containing protein [Fulvivirga lutimaris]
MKRLIIILAIITLFGCNSDNAPDCLKSAGSEATQVYDLPEFDKMTINNEFKVYLTYGTEKSVSVTAGENLLSDISLEVINGELMVRNNAGCKWVRSYDFPILEITTDDLNLVEIIGGSEFYSTNTLRYPALFMKSKNSNGLINLDIDMLDFGVDGNEITNYYIEGVVTNLNLTFSSGDSRFDGGDLLVINAKVIHNGSNDIIVNVTESLTGSIGSTGDLTYVGQAPQFIDVNITNRGRLVDGTN